MIERSGLLVEVRQGEKYIRVLFNYISSFSCIRGLTYFIQIFQILEWHECIACTEHAPEREALRQAIQT